MTLKTLCIRLAMAIVVPVVLVTATLYPIFRAHLDARLEGAQAGAQAMLEAGQESLQRGMNESLNHALATAEMSLLDRYLSHVGETHSPYQADTKQLTTERLSSLFETLLTHYGRYTKLVLIDPQGHELLHVSHGQQRQQRSPAVSHADTEYFREAMTLFPRDLYVSPPGRNLRYENAGDNVVPVVNIATPVFDAQGERKGVLLFSLDWQYLTAGLRHVMSIDESAEPLLVDARGTWLLADTEGPMRFGRSFSAESPDAWEVLSQRNRGQADLGNRLLLFQAEDIRTQNYRSQAGMVYSLPGYNPWRLGIMLPKPSLGTLLSQDRAPLLIMTLLYGLSITFGVFWALSSHRQGVLKQQAQRHAREIRDLYEHAPCGYHSLDAEGRIVKMNRTELNWLGHRAEEVIGKVHYRDFITPGTREAFDEAFLGVLGPDQEGSAECELITRRGETLPVVIQASAYTTRRGFVHSRAMVFDLSERKQMEETLARQAMTDPLTGLGNRRYLQDQAAMEIGRAKRSGEPLSLIAIDLDHFKRINDTYGHDGGDLVLQAFARQARKLLREGDVLCRMGGEEFAVLLPNTPKAQAMQVAERLRTALEASPVVVGHDVTVDSGLSYTASLGVTLVMAEEASLKPAIKRADQGLYAAKEAGRNQTHWQAV
ncbi:diguanylate cyclase [Halomonas sp. LR5S13]|uniref:diguanylate cyclase n=1 Tax=Halomonas rhizosphaerae TaxID=3043296 RepID=UPI0024A8ECB1|nr:diguanylate cyclase [Halomonas rhizosphaerae]MDI5921177.1 diguanylate cyclase [Halomonas rhizosphaerae]